MRNNRGLVYILLLCVGMSVSAAAGACFVTSRLWKNDTARHALPPRYMKNEWTKQFTFNLDGRSHHAMLFAEAYSLKGFMREYELFSISWSQEIDTAEEIVGHYHFWDDRFHTTLTLGGSSVSSIWHPNVAMYYKEFGNYFYEALSNRLEENNGEVKRDELINLLLSFCQDIPYGVPPDFYKGKKLNGLHPPPLIVEKMWGDCDSKAVLFCSILSNNPEIETAFVHVPNHILVGIKGVPKPYQDYVERLGETYIVAEPVGPRHGELGAAFSELRSVRGVIRMSQADVEPLEMPAGFFTIHSVSPQDDEKSGRELEEAIGLYEAGKTEAAFESFREVVLNTGGDELGLLYLAKCASELGKPGSDELIRTAVDTLIKKPKKKSKDYLLLGDLYKASGENGTAYRYYEKAYEADPANYKAAYALGSLLYQTKKYTAAVPYYTKVFEENPEYQKVKLYLGICYLHTGDEEKGNALIEEVCPAGSGSLECALELGDYYFTIYDPKQAYSRYDSYVQGGGKDDKALRRLGKLCFVLGEYTKGAACFDVLIPKGDHSLTAAGDHYWRGFCLEGSGDETAALKDFTEASDLARSVLQDNFRELEAFHYYGLASAELDQDRAEKAYHLLMKRASGDVNSRYYLQLSLARLIERVRSPYDPVKVYRTALQYYEKTEDGFMADVTAIFLDRIR